MPVDASGIFTYSESDTVTSWPAFMNLGMNSVKNTLIAMRSNLLYTASSLNHMTDQKNMLVGLGVKPNASNLLIFYRTDEKQFYGWNGSKFIKLAEETQFDESAVEVTDGTWHYAPESFNMNVTFPKAGLYLVSVTIACAAYATDTTLTVRVKLDGKNKGSAYFYSYEGRDSTTLSITFMTRQPAGKKTFVFESSKTGSAKANYGGIRVNTQLVG